MIYILSEIHGVKENAQAIEYVIRKYNIKSIYIEFKKRYEKSRLKDCLVIMGKAHAKLFSYKQNVVRYLPFAYKVSRGYEVEVIEIVYKKGEYYNFGIH